MHNKRAFHKQCSHHKSDHSSHRGEGNKHQHSRRREWKEKFNSLSTQPPVNVRELDDKYELHLFAPGYEKEDFLIAMVDKNLSISVEDKKEDQTSWRRMEYNPQGFVRQFELNEKIDPKAISAAYNNGVLIISLAKLEGYESDRQEIKIS